MFSNLRTEFINSWENAKKTSPKLTFYNTLKYEFGRENYLEIKKYDHRSSITRLRISAHDLEIERGRYKRDPTTKLKLPRDKRLCVYCKEVLNIESIEDELHAITDCPLYIKPRLVHASKADYGILESLEDSTNCTLYNLSILGNTCFNMFELRDAFIEYINHDESDSEP